MTRSGMLVLMTDPRGQEEPYLERGRIEKESTNRIIVTCQEESGPARRPIHALVYGPSGTGKTHFAAGFPSGGRIEIRRFVDPVPKSPSALESLNAFLDGGKHEPFGTIVLDGLTGVVQAGVLYARYRLNNPDARSWRYAASDELEQGILPRLSNFVGDLVVIAHLDFKPKDAAGNQMFFPAVPGQLAMRLSGYFPEVYRSYAETDDSTTAYRLQTRSDDDYACKSLICKARNGVRNSYDALWKDARNGGLLRQSKTVSKEGGLAK